MTVDYDSSGMSNVYFMYVIYENVVLLNYLLNSSVSLHLLNLCKLAVAFL